MKQPLKVNHSECFDYIDMITERLGLSEQTKTKANLIQSMAFDEFGFSDPVGIAVGSVYIAAILCDEKRTQKQISECVDTTQHKVMVWYKRMANTLDTKLLD